MCISTAAGAAASDADEVARPRKPVPLGLFRPISLRPEAVELRIEPGHWEGDLIIGARNGSGVVALIDRVCHYCLLGDLPEGGIIPRRPRPRGTPGSGAEPH
jgi:IS30 family transposase